MTYDLIVVGDGLAARVFLYELNKCVKSRGSQIPNVAVISDSSTFAPCSVNTTATICKVGLQEGVGEHGDRLLLAYECFESFLAEIRSEVKSDEFCLGANHYQCFMGEGEDRFSARYGEISEVEISGAKGATLFKASRGNSYLVSPLKLLSYLEENSSSHLNITRIKDRVIALNHLGTLVGSKSKYQTRCVLVAAGGAGEELLADTNEFGVSPKVGQSVFGSYLEWTTSNPIPSLGSSWQVGLSKFNVIYRQSDRKLLLGGTTTKNAHCFHPHHMMEQYLIAQKKLAQVLPAFDEAEFKVGERSKLAGRRPFWGEISGQTLAIRGLYKNGFTLSFLAAKELVYGVALWEKMGE